MREFFKNINIIITQKQKKHMFVLVIMMIISAILEVCGISSILPIIYALLDTDFMYENSYAVILCDILNINSYVSFVIACVSILLIVFLLKNLFLIFKNYYHAKFALNFQNEVREKVFHYCLNKDYRFFLNNNSSDINKTLLADVGNTYSALDCFLSILASAIVSFFLMIAVFIIDWRISLVIFLLLSILFFIIILSIKPTIKKCGFKANRATIERNKWINQSILGIKTVKLTQTGLYFENKASEADMNFCDAERNHSVLVGLPKMIIELFTVTTIVLLIVFLVLSGEDMNLLIPKIGAIGLAALKLLPGVNGIISNVISIQYRIPFLRRVSQIIQEKPEEVVTADFPDLYKHEIKINDITFRYREATPLILDKASLVIPIGSMIGIIGTSGEGKTTFIDVLLGLLKPENGEILVDGVNIKENMYAWRDSIGYITQDVFLLDDSIKSNVAFGVKEEDINETIVWDSLAKAQIDEFVKSLPDGIYTNIGERGVRLSGGQRQRIGIARALYRKPQVMIFDEATSSLDSETERAVVDAINSLYGSLTILVIAHRSTALKRCDKIYKIENRKFNIVT